MTPSNPIPSEPTPADIQLFKTLGIAFPADLVRLVQPDLAPRLELDILRFRPDACAAEATRRRATLIADAGETLLQVEIRSAYNVAIRESLLEGHRLLALGHARVVHTAVIYLRGGPAGLQRAVYPEGTHGQVSTYFCYNLFGLERAPAEEYLARAEPLAWALAAWMTPAVLGSREELLGECRRRIADAGLSPARSALLFECIGARSATKRVG